MALEITAQIHVDGGLVERLMCHPRLPLIAGWDSERPALHVWDYSDGSLRARGTIGGDRRPYGEDPVWERHDRIPAAVWHPHEPLLVAAVEGETVQWSADGASALAAVPACAAYRSLAFSPDGHALWASPASTGDDDGWESSDVIDLVTGAVTVGPRWDTGVAEHPGGGLLATLRSDQGATYVAFARVGPGAVMRQLDKTLILNVDGYETPVFSADGRHFAVRGNAYEHSLEVFTFPSLQRVLGTTLGPPCPGYPYPPEWKAEMATWSRHNVTFGLRPGVLWIGTPAGVLVEFDVEAEEVAEHDVVGGSPVTALACAPSGALVVADGAGVLRIVSAPVGPAAGAAAAAAAVQAFVAQTAEVADDEEWEDVVVRTDGTRTWGPDDLEELTEADEHDPGWLQIRAFMNRATAVRDA